MNTRVKICGLKTLEDARVAIDSGADLLGFNFYLPSPRYVSPEICSAIVSDLRQRGATATLVGVFVNVPAGTIASFLDRCGLDLAQLSGDEPPETLAALAGRAYKALRPTSPSVLQEALARYPGAPLPPAWLVDAYRPGEYGGTGQVADWSLAQELAQRSPILLAGGLTPDNVTQAIRQVQPWGVDVASGVESTPGVKDPARIQAFIQAVHSC